MPMEKELLGQRPKNQDKKRCSAHDEFLASRPKRPDEYHEGFILRGDAL